MDLKISGRPRLQRQPLKLYFLLLFFASCVIQSFAIDVMWRRVSGKHKRLRYWARTNSYLRDCVSTSSSSTKPGNRDFDVLFPSTTMKRSPAVCMFKCRFCVFKIKLIVFCRSSWCRRPGILSSLISRSQNVTPCLQLVGLVFHSLGTVL